MAELQPRGVLIVGCGYSGLWLARRIAGDGVPVWGTTRSPARFGAIERAGAVPFLYEAGAGLPPELMSRVDVVVDLAGPAWGSGDDPTVRLLADLEPFALGRLVYASSTSVYGDHGGARVDEETPCRPQSPAGVRRLQAEDALRAAWSARGLPVVIARLPGIYGPGRSLLDRVRADRFRLVAGPQALSNRIHVEDLAEGLWAAVRRGRPGRAYLLCDDAPAPLDDVARLAAELAGVPLPPPVPRDEAVRTFDASRLAMLTDSKRLLNDLMHAELGVVLRYPSYREGLAAVAAAEAAAPPGSDLTEPPARHLKERESGAAAGPGTTP